MRRSREIKKQNQKSEPPGLSLWSTELDVDKTREKVEQLYVDPPLFAIP